MKKIITLFALTVSLFLTSESLSAQNSQLNQAEIEDKAKKEMISLDEELDLTTEQKQFVFKKPITVSIEKNVFFCNN